MQNVQQPVTITRSELDELLAKAVAATPAGHSSFTTDQLENVVSNGIQKAFVTIGISSSDPLEMQQDFAFLRSMRTGVEGLKSHGIKVMFGAILTGVGTVMWLGWKAFTSGSK